MTVMTKGEHTGGNLISSFLSSKSQKNNNV